uniref:Secreted protein n=1 Tax=Heliothis virescens TaxID=7102 RepID=A0A2A4IWH8_HELVI
MIVLVWGAALVVSPGTTARLEGSPTTRPHHAAKRRRRDPPPLGPRQLTAHTPSTAGPIRERPTFVKKRFLNLKKCNQRTRAETLAAALLLTEGRAPPLLITFDEEQDQQRSPSTRRCPFSVPRKVFLDCY